MLRVKIYLLIALKDMVINGKYYENIVFVALRIFTYLQSYPTFPKEKKTDNNRSTFPQHFLCHRKILSPSFGAINIFKWLNYNNITFSNNFSSTGEIEKKKKRKSSYFPE